MATYENYMNAARNADAAGDEDAARQLVQAALRVQGEAKAADKSDRTFGEMLYENIIGDGEVDTIGEKIGDVIGSGVRGLYRGATAAAELPEMAGRGAVALGQLATGQENIIPVTDTITGAIAEGAYEALNPNEGGVLGGLRGPELSDRGQTTAAQYAGTVGEFLGGGAGLAVPAKIASKGLKAAGAAKGAQIASDIGKAGMTAQGAKTAVIGGLASEGAGQLAEGTDFETAARVIGGFAGPAAAASAGRVINKTSEALRKKGLKSPAVETAEQAKNKAWDDFEQIAGKLAINMDDVNKDLGMAIAGQRKDLFVGYSAGAKGDAEYIDEAIKMVAAHTGDKFNASQYNNLMREMGNLYKRSGFKPQIKFIQENLQKTLEKNAARVASVLGGDAADFLKTANTQSRRFYKIKAFDEAMENARRNAASTGSGGNIVNTYKQAVKNILNSATKRRQFDPDEIIMMERFVSGTMSENMLRLMSKLSPTGNGLMAALNVGAAAANPAMLGVTAAGIASKGVIDAKTLAAVDQIKDTIMSGVRPKKRDKIAKDIMLLIGGTTGAEQ